MSLQRYEKRPCGYSRCSNRFDVVVGRRGRRREYCQASCRVAAWNLRKRTHEPQPVKVKVPKDPFSALCSWAKDTLRIPPGHPLSGQPMSIPRFAKPFLKDALDPSKSECALVLGRKNAKSAICAVILLGFLVGPVRAHGWRAGICSISKAKSRELRDQVEDIAKASGLSEDILFRRSPYPGSIESSTGKVEILSSEGGGGHSSSFDLSIIDETGLLKEKDRGLVNSMRSATSAKDGKVLHLSIYGDSPFIPELIGMRHEPFISVHVHQADEGARLDDPKQWKKANPGLGTIKSISYMEKAARRAMLTPSDEAHFLAQDMNRPGSPDRMMLCSPSDWERCRVPVLPPRSGPCRMGVDLGGSSAMTCAVLWFPDTGRMETYGALPGVPSIKHRQRKDQSRYDLMCRSGELQVYAGHRTVPVDKFLRYMADVVKGENLVSIGSDRYRDAETRQFVDQSGLPWLRKWLWRGTGASATADGSHDIRSFQRAVLNQEIKHDGGLMMSSAISNSSLRFRNNNPALERSGPGRVDALQAGVIAVGTSTVKVARSSWRYRGRVG